MGIRRPNELGIQAVNGEHARNREPKRADEDKNHKNEIEA